MLVLISRAPRARVQAVNVKWRKTGKINFPIELYFRTRSEHPHNFYRRHRVVCFAAHDDPAMRMRVGSIFTHYHAVNDPDESRSDSKP